MNSILLSQKKALELALNGDSLTDVLEILMESIKKELGDGVHVEVQTRGQSFGSDHLLIEGLKACWSLPLVSLEKKSLGALILYYNEYKEPTCGQLDSIELIAKTMALVLERQEVRKELQLNDEQLSMAISVSNVGFYEWDIQAGTLRFSDQMLRDWGLSEQPNGSLMHMIHEHDRDRVTQQIDEAIRLRSSYMTEYRVVKHDGSVAWFEVRGRVTYDKDGKPLRFFGTAVDITARKENEVTIREAKDAAEAASLAKSVFLANMSHEIRTPLSAIMGFVGLMKNPDISAESLRDYAEVIERNSDQLLRIVDDILDLSKVEAGKLTIEQIEFSLPQVLGNFSELMGIKARSNGIIFKLTDETLLPRKIKSDPIRIRQILTNIVGNALKFTTHGYVELSVRYKEPYLRFTVTDTGIGISPEQAQGLFEPFHQAESSTTRRFGGTGLGLALTRRLCESMGGSFYLDCSEVGKGSTFVAYVQATLPEIPEFVSQEIERFTSNKNKGPVWDSKFCQDMKVLMIDDSQDNRELVRILLSRSGAIVETACDGAEGLRAALNYNYDLVLMDIQMPNMDGCEATRKLRASGYKHPIIALTAHAMKDEQSKIADAGFSDFLFKPIQTDLLFQTIAKLTH